MAERIASERKRRGITQEELASRLDIAAKNLQRIESGRQNLTLRTVERVAAALQVDAASFFSLHDPVRSSSGSTARRARSPDPLERLGAAGFEVGGSGVRRPAGAVLVTTLAAAGGALSRASSRIATLGWVRIPERRTSALGWFVAEVKGDSMAPRIPDGALCLFRPALGALPLGRVVLLEHRARAEPDLEGPFAVKRLLRVEQRGDGPIRVSLGSDNPQFSTVVISLREADELRVLAELSQVLVS